MDDDILTAQRNSLNDKQSGQSILDIMMVAGLVIVITVAALIFFNMAQKRRSHEKTETITKKENVVIVESTKQDMITTH
jgi:flagellar basal body-associated protein FliL